jgi:hypothetical protein
VVPIPFAGVHRAVAHAVYCASILYLGPVGRLLGQCETSGTEGMMATKTKDPTRKVIKLTPDAARELARELASFAVAPRRRGAHVVEAYMTHSRTPFITERFSDGHVRKVARTQISVENGWAIELEVIKATYGEKWTGVRTQNHAFTLPKP